MKFYFYIDQSDVLALVTFFYPSEESVETKVIEF